MSLSSDKGASRGDWFYIPYWCQKTTEPQHTCARVRHQLCMELLFPCWQTCMIPNSMAWATVPPELKSMSENRSKKEKFAKVFCLCHCCEFGGFFGYKPAICAWHLYSSWWQTSIQNQNLPIFMFCCKSFWLASWCYFWGLRRKKQIWIHNWSVDHWPVPVFFWCFKFPCVTTWRNVRHLIILNRHTGRGDRAAVFGHFSLSQFVSSHLHWTHAKPQSFKTFDNSEQNWSLETLKDAVTNFYELGVIWYGVM